MTEPMKNALAVAIDCANRSPCQKSKRGVAIFCRHNETVIGCGHNHRPDQGGRCDGSEACRRDCGEVCVHADQHAILGANWEHISGAVEIVHIKTVDGKPVASGGPSCVECSKLILASAIDYVWLLESDGWRRYHNTEFHAVTLKTCGLHDRFEPQSKKIDVDRCERCGSDLPVFDGATPPHQCERGR